MLGETLAITNYLEHATYFGVFTVLLGGGYVIPLPEEVLLLFVGYLIGINVIHNIYLAMLAAVLGVIVGDAIVYLLARRGSRYLEFFRRRMAKHKLMRYQDLMRAHIGKTVFSLRFFVGLRFFGPLLAGSLAIPWPIFAFYNSLAALIYAPLLVFIGYHFHSRIAVTITEVEAMRHVISIAAILSVGLVITLLNKKFLTKPALK